MNLKALNRKQFYSYSLLLCIALSFVLYGNTLRHDYALDDAIVITKNEFTKQGVNGIGDILTHDSFTGFFGRQKKLVEGGRYRPLSLVLFAVEYQLFGENPFVGHLFNILWYALLCFLILVLLHQIFLQSISSHVMIAALAGCVWFLIHPIHTEAVANIKGRDEILSLLFSVGAFLLVIAYVRKKKLPYLVLGAISLFLGCMAKENAISFVVIIPLALFFLYREEFKGRLKVFVVMLVPALLFIIIRNQVLGGFSFAEVSELMNNPFVNASAEQRVATVLFTWLIYLKLLIFPHSLTYDYYPYHIQLHEFSEPVIWLSIAMLGFVIWGLFKSWRKSPVVAFSILGFVLSFSLVSNVFFPVGVFMNERFVFIPSLFLSLLLAYILSLILKKQRVNIPSKVLLIAMVAYFIAFYPVKTIVRNRDWKDDLTLFLADVKTSNNSAKSNCSAGGKLWEKGKAINDETEKKQLFRDSEKYLRKSLEIYPTYTDAWLLLGNVLFDAKKDIEGSTNAYLEVLKRQSANENALNNMDIVLQQSTDRNLQLERYKAVFKTRSNHYIPNYRLGVLYGRYFGDLKQGIYYLERAVQFDGEKVEAMKDLGTAYGMSNQKEMAYEQFSKAIRLDSTDQQLLINLSVAARQLGKISEADYYIDKYNHLKIKNKK